MKNLLLIFSMFLISFNCLGQETNSCNKPELTRLVDKVVKKLNSKELKELKKQKTYNENVRGTIFNMHIFNYEDYNPVIELAKRKQLENIPEYILKDIITEFIYLTVNEKSPCLKEMTEVYFDNIKKKRDKRKMLSKLDSIDGVYIPIDISDAINKLDRFYTEKAKREIRLKSLDEFKADSHLGTGMWIRNDWGLWSGSRLAVYFNKLGLSNPEDMSSILLECFYNSVNNKPLNIDRQISFYNDYWEYNRPPKKKDFPDYVKDVEWNFTTSGDIEDFYNGVKIEPNIHFYTDIKEEIYWVYYFRYGWKKFTKSQFISLKKSVLTLEVVKRIFEIDE